MTDGYNKFCLHHFDQLLILCLVTSRWFELLGWAWQLGVGFVVPGTWNLPAEVHHSWQQNQQKVSQLIRTHHGTGENTGYRTRIAENICFTFLYSSVEHCGAQLPNRQSVTWIVQVRVWSLCIRTLWAGTVAQCRRCSKEGSIKYSCVMLNTSAS